MPDGWSSRRPDPSMKFNGFLTVYEEARAEDPRRWRSDRSRKASCRSSARARCLSFAGSSRTQHFTQPPPRYNEASLVKALESRGIGRPSTYATILSTIQDREYAVKQEGKFLPTETGEVVVELLVESFQELFDYEYTARMEDHLDRIESGREQWNESMKYVLRRSCRAD